MQSPAAAWQRSVPLAPYTTLGLGGPARYLLDVCSVDDACHALRWARQEGQPVHILGGGSNTIFADEGFPGLVLRVAGRGLSFREEGGQVYATVAAGEPWDGFVAGCVDRGLAGIECLSGIPGLVGATPIQNVGAYGQEVAETVVAVSALDRERLVEVSLAGAECGFAYRDSRFKGPDRGRYLILGVTYRLEPGGRPQVRYAELRRYLDERGEPHTLARVRQAVLALRRGKSMLYDLADPHSHSVGSFFLNPILTPGQVFELESRWRAGGGSEPPPRFPAAEGVKVPAAWLVEQAGFHRGLRYGGVGISDHHCLALVNYAGTTRELLSLARQVQEGVYERFGVWLEMEPEVVGEETLKVEG